MIVYLEWIGVEGLHFRIHTWCEYLRAGKVND